MAPAGGSSVALGELARALRSAAAQLEQLAARADRLRAQLDGGEPLPTAIAAEPRPLITTEIVRVTDTLHEVGGVLRRAEAQELQAHGYSHARIARELGVTRQRVSALLRSGGVRRPSKRPRGG